MNLNLTYTSSRQSLLTSVETPVVHVVDSDASVREALDIAIRTAGWQPRMAASAEEFLALPHVVAPGCMLVELDLPGLGGLELQRRLCDRTEMPIVFMSAHVDVQSTVQAMKGGAFEFLTKPIMRHRLLDAIGGAIEHSHGALRSLAQIHALQLRYESLSRREREVMSLVVSGRLNKQVGGELGISEITVKAHRGKMMRKMKASSFAELVTMAASLRGAGQQRAIAPYAQA